MEFVIILHDSFKKGVSMPVATIPAPTRPLPIIRPITDLRLHLNEVCEQAKETREPIVLTKNGTAAFVLVDSDTYEDQQQANRIYLALREVEIEEQYRPESISAKDADDEIRKIFGLWNIDYDGLKGIAYE